MSSVHRPGPFKQPSKKHKTGGHRSKGELDRINRGRVSVKEATQARPNRSLSRSQRKNQIVQKRTLKRENAMEQKRSLGGAGAPPTLATLLMFGESTPSSSEFIAKLSQCDETIVQNATGSAHYFTIPRFKSRLGFLTPNHECMDDVLDALKVSDVLCMVWPLDGSISESEEILMSAMLAHGIPSVINIAPGLGSIVSSKQKDNAKSNVKLLMEQLSPASDKIMCADTPTDGLNIVRAIVDMKKSKLVIQKRRAHMLVEKLATEDVNRDDNVCTLTATGYVRGPAWNVNRLVHLPGLGDFQVTKIVQHTDPNSVRPNKGEWTPTAVTIVSADEEKQDTLQSEIVPDPLEGEQANLDEDIKLTEEALQKEGPMKRRVPKGTSAYQANWIIDSDEEAEGEDEEESEEDEDSDDDMQDEAEDVGEDDENEEVAMEDTATEAGESMFMDDEIDMDEVEKYRKERENAQFPDELDTPLDMPARVRFQKYRGMKSFRTSFWDKYENLPFNYARIFKFQNFKKTKKNVLKDNIYDIDGETAPHGAYVTVYIANVPTSYPSSLREGAPFILYSMLPHEQKMSVANYVIRKHPSCTVPIINKSSLIFHVGYRKFEAQPIFSQHTNGDKFKMERFLRPDGAMVASVFAPIMFPPSSVLVFRKDAKGVQHLVASGSILDNNPDRIVVKRIVLSGHPYKINKRSCVVRYMFFNREDIEWFKPVELHTPRGRRGHIKEVLGTHGYMKCRFDQQLNAQDNVMMSLYKRVFPKWTYMSVLPSITPITNGKDEEEMEEE